MMGYDPSRTPPNLRKPKYSRHEMPRDTSYNSNLHGKSRECGSLGRDLSRDREQNSSSGALPKGVCGLALHMQLPFLKYRVGMIAIRGVFEPEGCGREV